MANNIANQTKNAQVNSFTGGINTDLHPMLQPNNTLTDCVNGTLITYNGNENMLQNDMGNYALEGAKLPPNYVPIGVKEHAGILYVVAYNPTNKNVQIGSYPSPKVNFGKFGEEEATITVEPYRIKKLMGSSDDSFDPFDILDEQYNSEQKEGHHLYSNVVKGADNLLKLLGTMDYDGYKLTINDQYELILPPGSDSDAWLQELMFFSVSKDGKIENISEKIITHSSSSDYSNVGWQSEGWLGVKYELVNVSKSTQTITNVAYPTYGRTVNTVWTVDERDEYKIATANLSQKYSYYEDPFIMIPNNENDNLIWQKHYWQFEVPEEDNVLIYYSKNEWNPKAGIKYSVSTSPEQSYYHKIVFEDSIQNLGDIMPTYNYSSLDGENYLYLFLPKYASINETSAKLFNSNLKLFVFIHPDNKENFVFKSDLEFINKPANTAIHADNARIKELYCSEYNDLTVDYNKVGVFIDGSTNDELSVPSFPNIISDSKIKILTDSDASSDEEYLTITYETITGMQVGLGSEFKTKVVEHTYEKGGVGKITFLGKTISEKAFEYCDNLESITLPYGITYVGDRAFAGCTRLKELVIPHSVEFLGYEAFCDCTQLTSLTISNKVRYVSLGLCANCTSLSSVGIGTGVKEIGVQAFSGCSALVDINIPASVLTIHDNAFENCGLKKIILPDSIKTIGMSAFEECSELKYCKLPRNMEVLDNYTFRDCELKTLVCGHKLTKIGIGSVPANTRIYILNSEQPVDFSTLENFSEGTGLTKTLDIYIPEFMEDKYISNSFGSVTGFDEKSNLIYFADEKLSIGDTPEFYEGVGYFSVGESLRGFEAQKIHTVIIPESVTSIAEDAFKNSSIQSIFIPTNVKSIESKAFYNCAFLKYVEFESGAINFKEDAFGASKIDIVRVPSVKDWCDNIFANRQASPIKIPLGTLHHTIETRLYIGDESDKIEVPKEVTSLNSYTFAGLANVTISIPHNLREVDKHAFAATLLNSTIVIEYHGSEITERVDVETFENTTVYVKPELYYKYMFDLKLLGTWKALYTNVYITGKDSDLWVGDVGEIIGPTSSDNIHYFVPESWQNRGKYSSDKWKLVYLPLNRMSASVKDVDYEEDVLHKYIYNNVRISDKNIIGWKFSEENNLEIYALSGVDTSVEVKIETVSSGNWKWSTHAPYKVNNTTSDKKESVTWYLEKTQVAVSTGDLLKFTVNNEFRLPKTIWKKVLDNKTCNIKLAIRLTGYSEDGSTFNTKFADEKSYYCIDDVRTKEFAGFIDVFTNFDFSESIPAHIKKINIESVLFCVENQDTIGQLLVLDQTLQSDTILLPEYENIDNSSAEVIGFTYSVTGTGEDKKVDDSGMRTVECIFTFNEFIESEDVGAVLRDLSGDSVIYGTTSSGGVNNEHVIKFFNVPKEFQFAQLELIVESSSKFKENILINTKVTTSDSEWFNRINMSTIPWNKVIDEIIADIDNNEWDLNVSVEVDESQAVSKPCVYGLNENNEIVDLTEWTEDTIPANVVPIVNEDGFIPEYKGKTFADLVYASIKVNVTLGHGIKIEGDVSINSINFDSDEILVQNENSTSENHCTCIGLNKIHFSKKNIIRGIPYVNRWAKYFYKPLGLNTMLSNNLSEHVDLFENAFQKHKGVHIKSNLDFEMSIVDVEKLTSSPQNYNSFEEILEQMPAVFPIYITPTNSNYGINEPIYINKNTTFLKNVGVKHAGAWYWKDITTGRGDWNFSGATFGVTRKKDSMWVLGLNCVSKHIKFPWMQPRGLWTKDELLKHEKLLFLAFLSKADIGYFDVQSNTNVYSATWNVDYNYAKNMNIMLKNVKCSMGRLPNIQLTQINLDNILNPTTINSTYNNIFIQHSEICNPICASNLWFNSFLKKIDENKVDDSNIKSPRSCSISVPKNHTQFGFDKIAASHGYEAAHIRGLGYTTKDGDVNYEYTYDDGSPGVGTINIEPWATDTEYDILNQSETSIYDSEGNLQLELNGQLVTKSIDEWLYYFLDIWLKELKYEQDYNKLKN